MKEVNCPTCKGTGKVQISTADTKELYKYFGAKIREARERTGLTQQEVATKAGLQRTSITNVEAGRQRTPIETMMKIADVLNTDFKEFLI